MSSASFEFICGGASGRVEAAGGGQALEKLENPRPPMNVERFQTDSLLPLGGRGSALASETGAQRLC